MATNKNQHFVPRCYLRPFTQDSADKCIDVFNVDRDRLIERAPVKSQCSGDYFYGKSDLLEAAIRSVEAQYASVLRDVLRPGYKLTEEHKEALKVFWLLQHLRTEAANRRAVEMANAFDEIVDPAGTNIGLQIREAVQLAMQSFAEQIDVLSDLKCCLVENLSDVPFVTSDDPAILTNRWHLQNSVHLTRDHTFALHSGGLVLLLPINPKVMFIAYDGDVHSIDQKDGWAKCRSGADADALNQHQYVNCRANIFMRDSAHFEMIRQGFQRVANLRPTVRYKMHYAVLDKSYGEYSRYVVVDPKTAATHERAIVHSQVVRPSPATWPTLLRWRAGGFVFGNGTGVGKVRRAFASPDARVPFKKIKINS